MAVTIDTEFYETTTSGWYDLAKVVFTSPNMDTPWPAGYRSHILPGIEDLATWYEDTSTMYRIFDEQVYSNEVEYINDLYGTTVSGFYIHNSIKFELTTGESYNNRLTAWDSTDHSTINNYLIDSDRVKVSAVAYHYIIGTGTEDNPETIVEVQPPVYNKVLKGNTTVSGVDNYYGDFNMKYYPNDVDDIGDILIFRPMLYNITSDVPYGVHDFVITLHYSYT
jgi:hypothetical protein